jgi:hypothetical protein
MTESLGSFIAPFLDKAEAPPRRHRPCAGDLDVRRGASNNWDGRDKPGHDVADDMTGRC